MSKAAVEKRNVVLQRLVVEYVPIGSIEPNDYNPNRQSTQDFELLCKSMQEDGVTQPIVVLRATRKIVDGEHRWRAAQAIGLESVPVVFTDMTPEQARIATLRHNRARGSEDVALAAQVLRDLAALGATDWLKDSLMLSDVDIDAFMQMPESEAVAIARAEGVTFDGDDAARANLANQIAAADSPTVKAEAIAEVSSASAATKLREIEQRVKNAKTDEERKMAKADSGLFRLVLVFDGDEAQIVKQALGTKVVDAILDICRAADAGEI